MKLFKNVLTSFASYCQSAMWAEYHQEHNSITYQRFEATAVTVAKNWQVYRVIHISINWSRLCNVTDYDMLMCDIRYHITKSLNHWTTGKCLFIVTPRIACSKFCSHKIVGIFHDNTQW